MFKYISNEDVVNNYKMEDVVNAVDQAYAKLFNKKIVVPQRVFTPTIDGGDYLYGAATNLDTQRFLVLGSAFMPWNKPAVRGNYMLSSFRTGDLLAIVDGLEIANIRTGAKSAVAVKYLAKESAETLGLIGLGKQMQTQVEAIVKVRNIKRIVAYTRSPENHKDTVEYIKNKTGLDVEIAPDVKTVVNESEIIVTSTYSKEPLITYSDLKPGQLVISTAHSEEVSRDLVTNCKTFADYLTSAKKENAPIKIALGEDFEDSKIAGDLTQLAAGNIKGRESDNEIIYFQSLGVMHENLAFVEYLFDKLSN